MLVLDQIAEQLAVCDESQRILALAAGEGHDAFTLAVDYLDGRAVLINAFGVARPAGDDRRRARELGCMLDQRLCRA